MLPMGFVNTTVLQPLEVQGKAETSMLYVSFTDKKAFLTCDDMHTCILLITQEVPSHIMY